MTFFLEKLHGRFEGHLKLEVDASVRPVQLPVRKAPVSVRPRLKAELDRLEKLKVIAPVTDPTDWVSSLNKPNGSIRICLDPKPLNKALKRAHYPVTTMEDILPDLTRARVFSVADVRNGFWHVELDVLTI